MTVFLKVIASSRHPRADCSKTRGSKVPTTRPTGTC